MTAGDPLKPNGRGGRPRLEADEKSIAVSLSLSARQYATLCRHARRRRVTPSRLLRAMLARFPGFGPLDS
jgi:hypothetical protein